MKKLTKILSLVMAGMLCLSATACGKKADGDNVLEIFCWDAGYGTLWCENLIEEFKKEDWVKEKYPNLVIDYSSDGDTTTYSTKLDSGASSNTLDLIFSGGVNAYIGNTTGQAFFADLTEKVFNTQVPGETGTVYDKMLPSYLDSIRFYEKGQDSNSPNVPFKSYTFPWASGFDGILYNVEHLEALDWEVPLTTTQFVEYCDEISSNKHFPYNNTKDGDYAILRNDSGAYWNYLYPIWWGQYEGIEEYYNFFNGVHDGAISAEVYKQKGKLHGLQAMEDILLSSYGYVYKHSNSLPFMTAQSNFLQGQGVFYANGDWFAKEMEEAAENIDKLGEKVYEIGMMRTPIVSNIIEKTKSIPSEEVLRGVIRAIDAGYGSVGEAILDPDLADIIKIDYAKFATVTEDDYEVIKHARGIVHAIGPNHQAVVPDYALGKEIAFDFLRYMATDKAQEIYMMATGGASLPFKYDAKTKNPELYSTFSRIEKDVQSYLYDSCYETNVLPDPNAFPLVKWGEMVAVHSTNSSSLVPYFTATGTEKGAALKLFNADIELYVNGGQFATCLDKAGLS